MVRPLEFVIPFTTRGWSLDLGLWIYDRLGGSSRPGRHQRLSREEVQRRVPALQGAAIRGGHSYWDARTEDTRLTLHVLKHAAARGALIANYVSLVGFLRDRERTTGALAEDEETGERFELPARMTVLATGVWLDRTLALLNPDHRPRITPARGVHLVVPASRLLANPAFTLRAADGRPVFALPWLGRTLVGTTDTVHDGSLSDPRATAADLRYLLDTVNSNCPNVSLRREDVLAVLAGLRPLIDARSPDTARASREDKILTPRPGAIAVAGGKLTTYRRMAQRVVDAIVRELADKGVANAFGASRTSKLRLTGPYQELDDVSIPAAVRAYLAEAYPADAGTVIRAPQGAEPMVDGSPFVWGEIDHAVRGEMALHLEDVLTRRTRLALTDPGRAGEVAPAVASRMGDLLNWDANTRRAEIARYHRSTAAFEVPEN